MKTLLTAILISLCVAVSARPAAQTVVVGGLDGIDPWNESKNYPIGLALSGGGARGLSAVGLLRAFEEQHIEVVALAGTSIGSVIGGLYACGYTPDELEQFVEEIEISTLISNRPKRSSMFLTSRQEREKYLLSVRFDGWRLQIPSAISGGQAITSLLTRLTTAAIYRAGQDFTRLPIPFKAVGTDIVTGQAVELSSGSLADAMRASLAFPLAFTGVEHGDSLLMDGGILMPVPVELLRPMLDSTIPLVAVNTTSVLASAEDLLTPFDIANQVTTIMTADNLQRQLDLADIVISPVKNGLSASGFKHRDSLIALGYAAGLEAAAEIIAAVEARRDTRVYQVSQLQVVGADSNLVARFETAGLDQPFTRLQLIEDLKTLARTEPVFSITANWQVDPNALDTLPTPPVILTVDIQPQPLVKDIAFKFVGNVSYDALTLSQQCDFADDHLSAVELQRCLDRMINLYRIDGHDLAEVTEVRLDLEHGEVTVVIDEAIVSRIDVANNERSRDWLLRSYFPVKKGEPFSMTNGTRGLADLFGTELFERVTFDLEKFDSTALITIRVKEKKYGQLRMGWHWHDEYQSEQFLELLDDNVNGVGLELLAHLQYGTDRQNYFTRLRFNRIFFTYLTARWDMFYTLLDRNLFTTDGAVNGFREEDRYGFSFYVGQQLGRLGQVSAGLRVENVEVRDHRENSSTIFGLRTLHFESVVETFDRSPFPTDGHKLWLDLRLAGKLLGGEIEYTRFQSAVEAYYPFRGYLTYHPKFMIGLSRRGLPESEKFFAGGVGSFSGYRTNELSGDKIFLLSQELRLQLLSRLYLTGRFDWGDVFARAQHIKPAGFRHGFGVSLALDSPVGPVEIGYGGGDSPKDRVYFSAGFSF